MKKVFILISLVCSFAFAEKIGFKGIYLGDDLKKGCEILNSLSAKGNYREFKKGDVVMLAGSPLKDSYGKPMKEQYDSCSKDGSTVKGVNNQITGIELGKNFTENIIGLKNYNIQQASQELVNNIPWLPTLNQGKELTGGTYNGFKDLKKGFEFKIYRDISFKLDSIEVKKVSF